MRNRTAKRRILFSWLFSWTMYCFFFFLNYRLYIQNFGEVKNYWLAKTYDVFPRINNIFQKLNFQILLFIQSFSWFFSSHFSTAKVVVGHSPEFIIYHTICDDQENVIYEKFENVGSSDGIKLMDLKEKLPIKYLFTNICFVPCIL